MTRCSQATSRVLAVLTILASYLVAIVIHPSSAAFAVSLIGDEARPAVGVNPRTSDQYVYWRGSGGSAGDIMERWYIVGGTGWHGTDLVSYTGSSYFTTLMSPG